MNNELYNKLINTYFEKYSSDDRINCFYNEYTEPLIRKIANLISDPNKEHDENLDNYITEYSFKIVRKYFAIKDYPIEISYTERTFEGKVLTACTKLVARIIFEAQLQYLTDLTNENGELDKNTHMSNYFFPITQGIKHIERTKGDITIFDLKVLFRSNEINRCRGIGLSTKDDIKRFLNVFELKVEKRPVSVEPITLDTAEGLFNGLITKYNNLLDKKQKIEAEISRYEELLKEKKAIEEEINVFEENIKLLNLKLGAQNGSK